MKAHLQALLEGALAAVWREAGREPASTPPSIQIDATKDTRHGDFATNLALTIAKPLGKPPRAVAELLIKHLPASSRVTKVEIAGPGFINFFVASTAFQQVVLDVLAAGAEYGCDRSGMRGSVLVEFVSANPTGPMHVGHGRGAAYGDSLANILAATGWKVSREYYVNDAGRQVDILTVSVWIRCLQALGEELPFPARGYPADYIKATATRALRELGDALRRNAGGVLSGLTPEPDSQPEAGDATRDELKKKQETYIDALIERARTLLGDHYAALQALALEDQLATIRATLDAFGVHFDVWSSEKAVVDSGFAAKAIERLSAQGHVFVKDGATFLRTTTFGDEKDRVLFKADGAATYFANDLAYHVDKLDRVQAARAGGEALLLDVWGADHHGYIARVRAAIEALTGRKDALLVQLMQFVTLKTADGEAGRMGKRSGNFVTLADLVDEAGTDATRFFYLMRSHDQHLEFDVELARKQSNDNPVYYVQYAHARIGSVFRQLAERGGSFDVGACGPTLEKLVEPHEKTLLTALQKYPEMLRNAGSAFSPHAVTFYLRDLADGLHSYYNAHKFLGDDASLQTARLALISAVRVVLANGLGMLGVSAPETM